LVVDDCVRDLRSTKKKKKLKRQDDVKDPWHQGVRFRV